MEYNHGMPKGNRMPVTITKDAKHALRRIAKSEGKKEHGLMVCMDEHGGFCLEFDAKCQGVTIDPRIRSQIYGATIDFRSERFCLDLPECQQPCSDCASTSSCSSSCS